MSVYVFSRQFAISVAATVNWRNTEMRDEETGRGSGLAGDRRVM